MMENNPSYKGFKLKVKFMKMEISIYTEKRRLILNVPGDWEGIF